jgi:hypothetical protein
LRPSTSDEVATRHRPAPLCPSCGAKRYGTFLRAIFDDSKKDLPTFSLLHRADVLQRAFRGHRKDLWAEPQDCLRVAPARVRDRGRLRAGPQARPVQAKAVHRRGHRRLQARARRRARQAFPRIRDSLRSHIAKGSTVVGDMEKSHRSLVRVVEGVHEAYRAHVSDPQYLECMALVNKLCF